VFHILVIIYTLPLRAVCTVQAGECVLFTLLCSSLHGVSDIVNGFPKMCEGEEDGGRAIETFLELPSHDGLEIWEDPTRRTCTTELMRIQTLQIFPDRMDSMALEYMREKSELLQTMKGGSILLGLGSGLCSSPTIVPSDVSCRCHLNIFPLQMILVDVNIYMMHAKYSVFLFHPLHTIAQ